MNPHYISAANFIALGTALLGISLSEIDSTKIHTARDSTNYLQAYGYLPAEFDNAKSRKREIELKNSIKMFQGFAGVKVTGKMDRVTMNMMNRPRCGMPERMDIMQNKDLNSKMLKHIIPSASGIWKTSWVHYKIHGHPYSSMSPDQMKNEVRRAFKLWENVVNLRFIEVPETDKRKAHIEIKFASGPHGDGSPFGDRSVGNVVAHAFFPGQTQYEGNVHFDDDRDWTANTQSGINLYQVAAHEIGHALGLEHSMESEAIMYMNIRNIWDEYFVLHEDDIRGIQNLYGVKKRPQEITSSTDIPRKFVKSLDRVVNDFWQCFPLGSKPAAECYRKNSLQLVYSLNE